MLALHWKTREKLIRLKGEAERAGEYRVARRLHAVILNSEQRTAGDVAVILGAPRTRVSEWIANYETFGVEGLLEGFRPGRPPLLFPEDLTALHDIVESGPAAYGLDSGVWTSPMLARVIEEEYGVTYHPGHVRKLLHKISLSVQRPRRVLARADPEAQERWVRKTFPNLKKKPAAKISRSSSPTKPVSGRTLPSTRPGAPSVIRRKSQ
jgi:transposase